jgi:hypothetical protein
MSPFSDNVIVWLLIALAVVAAIALIYGTR